MYVVKSSRFLCVAEFIDDFCVEAIGGGNGNGRFDPYFLHESPNIQTLNSPNASFSYALRGLQTILRRELLSL